MKINSNIPKVFSIFVTYKNGKSGYIKYKSYQDKENNIHYTMNITENIKDASKYVNFDNTKKIARKISLSVKFIEVKVVDDKLMKFYKVLPT